MGLRFVTLGVTFGLTLSLLLGGCQTMAGGRTATIDLGDVATRATVVSVLSDAVHRARIELGAGDGTVTSVVMVLPPPLGPHETHSPALPIRFDIELRDGQCVAVRHDSGEAFDLPGVTCR